MKHNLSNTKTINKLVLISLLNFFSLEALEAKPLPEYTADFETDIKPISTENSSYPPLRSSGNPPQIVAAENGVTPRDGSYMMKSVVTRYANTSSINYHTEAEVEPYQDFSGEFEKGKDYWLGVSVYIPAEWDMDYGASKNGWPVEEEEYSNGTILQFNDRSYADKSWRYGIPLAVSHSKQGFLIWNRGDECGNVESGLQDRPKCVAGTPLPQFKKDNIPMLLGQWNDFVMHIKWSDHSDGFIDIWVNGKKEVAQEGINYYSEHTQYPFFKMGLDQTYYQAKDITFNVNERTLYHDELRIGGADSSFEEVVPAGGAYASDSDDNTKTHVAKVGPAADPVPTNDQDLNNDSSPAIVTLVADAGKDKVLRCNDPYKNIGSTVSSSSDANYQWTTSDGHILSGVNNKTARGDKAGTYVLTVSKAGKTVSDEVAIIKEEGCNSTKTTNTSAEITPDPAPDETNDSSTSASNGEESSVPESIKNDVESIYSPVDNNSAPASTNEKSSVPQSSANIKTYNPPTDVSKFKRSNLFHSEILTKTGISVADVNALKSPRYKIEVKQKGAADSDYKQVFTYQSLNNLIQDSRYTHDRWARQYMTDANHWGSFDFKGNVTVKVTNLEHQADDVSVSPKSKNYSFTYNNGVTVFDLSESQLDAKNLTSHKVALKFSGSDTAKHPLFIFANKFETDAPSTNSDNVKVFEPGEHASGTYNESVLYFKPGLHTISHLGRIKVSGNTTVYLAGGAYVMGHFYSESQSNIKFKGRGILSGINQEHVKDGGWANASHLIDHRGNGSNFSVEGITLTDASMSNINFSGKKLKVNNVKVFSWRENTDGILLTEGSSVRDSFFKVNDDAIKLYKNDNKAEELVIWQQPSGAVFQLSWNNATLTERGYVNNIDVINSDFLETAERENDRNLNNAIISVRSFKGSNGRIDDFQFNNIRIEGSPYQLLDLGTADSLISGFKGDGGSVQNIVLKNITSEGTPRIPSYIKEEGYYGDVGAVTFENVWLKGEKMTGNESQIRVSGGAGTPIFK